MLEFEAMEVFKIPFLFSQIFLELKTKDPIQISCENLDYFNIIDQLYKINNNSSYNKKITFSNIFFLWFFSFSFFLFSHMFFKVSIASRNS